MDHTKTTILTAGHKTQNIYKSVTNDLYKASISEL